MTFQVRTHTQPFPFKPKMCRLKKRSPISTMQAAVGRNVTRFRGRAMNHKNHISGIVMHICPWSGPSISSISRNYFHTCKVRIINIRVNTIINHPCATAASELLPDDSQGREQSRRLLAPRAAAMHRDLLLIHYSYLGHYYSIVCGAKWDH